MALVEKLNNLLKADDINLSDSELSGVIGRFYASLPDDFEDDFITESIYRSVINKIESKGINVAEYLQPKSDEEYVEQNELVKRFAAELKAKSSSDNIEGADIDSKIEAVRSGLRKTCPQNHPIEAHPIAKVDEYVRGLYIDVLCSLARYAVKDSESRLSFVERIHAAAGLSTEFPEHIKNAMNITPERFDEFFKQCKENDLTIIFVVDCILIACADGKPNSKHIAFITEMFDALGLSKGEVSVLAELAAAILEQDNDKYFKVIKKIPDKDRFKVISMIFCYLKRFVSGVIVDNRELFWFYSNKVIDYDLEDKFHKTLGERENVWIENINICGHCHFRRSKNVIIRNCSSTGILYFKNIDNVRISDCKFNGFGFSTHKYRYNSLFDLENVNNFSIVNCKFTHYVLGENIDNKECGIIHPNDTDELCTIRISKSLFYDISVKYGFPIVARYAYSCYWARAKKTLVSDTEFNCCTSIYGLFGRCCNAAFENTKFTNCCKPIY